MSAAAGELVDRLEHLFHAAADRVFIERPGAAPATFRIVWDASAQYANLFMSLGIAPGDRVVCKAEKSIEIVLVYLACLRSGLVFLPVNPAFTFEETRHILDDAEPALIIDNVVAETTISRDRHSIKIEALATAAALQPTTVPASKIDGDAPAVILYTSGTTGRPKGATLSHCNILANGLALVHAWRFTSDDVLLHSLPLFHSHGLFVSLSCSLLTASRIILFDRFDLDLVLSHLVRATVFMGVPTMYVRLANDERLNPALCRSIRLFACGSAALTAQTFGRFEERSGCRIVERYGMTETAINSSNPIDGERRAGTVGRPLDGVTLEIRDASRRALPTGMVGAVHVRGKHVFTGYWGRPDHTAAIKSADGWFDTGDIGVVDADGYLTLVGRAKDLIITGGYNVYPAEVERALDRITEVRESAVVGLPHADLGEAVTAIVAMDERATMSEGGIRTAARDCLAGYKVPKRVVFVDELPRNHVGKVDKLVLRAKYATLYNPF